MGGVGEGQSHHHRLGGFAAISASPKKRNAVVPIANCRLPSSRICVSVVSTANSRSDERRYQYPRSPRRWPPGPGNIGVRFPPNRLRADRRMRAPAQIPLDRPVESFQATARSFRLARRRVPASLVRLSTVRAAVNSTRAPACAHAAPFPARMLVVCTINSLCK